MTAIHAQRAEVTPVSSDVSDAARKLLESTREDEARRARERLAAVVRRDALAVLHRLRDLSDADAEDVAQQATVRICRAIEQRMVERGREPGYVSACARYAATDFFRRRAIRRRFEVNEPVEEEVPERAPGPEQAVLHKQEQRWLSTVLAILSESDRELLLALVVDGSLDSFIRDAVVAEGKDPDDPPTWLLFRNRLHQRVSRARRFLRSHLAKRLKESRC